MQELAKEQRRANRGLVLDAIREETGSDGDNVARPRVEAYCADPVGASTGEFIYVGSLILRRFYVDPSKPNGGERRSLWAALMSKMGKENAVDPGGWDGDTSVRTLQALAEVA